jgi:hypothetical protein
MQQAWCSTRPAAAFTPVARTSRVSSNCMLIHSTAASSPTCGCQLKLSGELLLLLLLGRRRQAGLAAVPAVPPAAAGQRGSSPTAGGWAWRRRQQRRWRRRQRRPRCRSAWAMAGTFTGWSQATPSLWAVWTSHMTAAAWRTLVGSSALESASPVACAVPGLLRAGHPLQLCTFQRCSPPTVARCCCCLAGCCARCPRTVSVLSHH